jgi:hypothetical protein
MYHQIGIHSYYLWANDTSGNSNISQVYTFQVLPPNTPPVFGTPFPANSSTEQLLSFTWSIPINDSEGNLFSWTIQCSNGQTNSGIDASNGTKTLNLSGLAYSTTYIIWVNATDSEPSGSGLYTRAWFVFTTKANVPPSLGTPNPANGSTGQPLSFSWSIPINDPDDLLSWTIQCSNGQVNSGSNEPAGSKSLALSGLSYQTTYTVWVNANDGYDWVQEWFNFTTIMNDPPVFGSPSPANGSTGQPISFNWSIDISDPEGDSFNWGIQCSNGQSNSGTGAANGTKSLVLSGLAYSTTYTVWVNATDPSGSNQYTREWYTFSTKASLPPVFSTPSPANGSTGQPISFNWSIDISDPEGDSFNWWIQCSNGESANANGASNGTKSLSLSGLAFLTNYTIWVNATDSTGSGLYTRAWFVFTTKELNNPPMFGSPTPANGSINQSLNVLWKIPIADLEGDLFDWTIQCSDGQTNSGTGASNGTKTLGLFNLSYSTTYTVWVNATDPGPNGSGLYTRAWYIFTTKENVLPALGTPNPANGSTGQPLSFTWSIPISDPDELISWTIQCNNGQSSSGNNESSGTKTLLLSNLSYATNYTVWVNATDGYDWVRGWFTFTTKVNQPPMFGSPSPENGSTNQSLSLSWSILISDPEGDLFDWMIECSNGQTNYSNNDINGTKSLELSNLNYLTAYTIWINATDPDGSGDYTRAWYTFTTQEEEQPNNPPNKPERPTGETNGKINTKYIYTTSTTDPDGDQVYYLWDWGDGTQSIWLGPYDSGEEATAEHTWTTKGDYSIKVKAKDTQDAESDWSDPLAVTMPYSYNPIQQFFEWLFQRFPNAFPILRHLLGY